MTRLDRRSFLQFAGALPLAWGARGLGACVPHGDDRALLVLELAGGNDGLNTVIPVDDERYAKLRPKLSAVRAGARRLADGTALHQALTSLHGLVTAGRATVLHGVGYPKPDRSHFRSRDVWHAADPELARVGASTTGWLGRAADLLAADSAGVPAAAIGGLEVPLLLKGKRGEAPSLQRIEDFQWLAPTASGPVGGTSPLRPIVANGGSGAGDDLRRYCASTAQRAVGLADDLAQALARYRSKADYPETPLGRDLRLTAQLVVSGFGTRLLHVAFPGFDTHARQLGTHAGLLTQLDAALAAFVADLDAHQKADRIAVLVHSEFGRRAGENASQGTDHGAAAPAFVLLGGARGGTLGPVPDLGRLDDGDPIATTDFRSVYRDLLDWLGIDALAVLGCEHATAGLWAAGR
ncbi:MAG: DUF1501 domain-containing protein [Planctomycetota bacterium]